MAKDSMQQASLFASTPLATKRLRASDDLPDPESRQEQFPIKKIRNSEKLEHRAESSITTRAQKEGVKERDTESMQLIETVDEVERLKKELEEAQKQCSAKSSAGID
ncbi:hypothetical protein B0O99DRAFT_682616 [Bisporella sp. PMI_857]|nr:hypothetical protein B0O99DRAFT_682616 [Bisporella sp. PMI_857]